MKRSYLAVALAIWLSSALMLLFAVQAANAKTINYSTGTLKYMSAK